MVKGGDGQQPEGRLIGPCEKELRAAIEKANRQNILSGGAEPSVATMLAIFFQIIARSIDETKLLAAKAAGVQVVIDGEPQEGRDGGRADKGPNPR